MESRVQRPENKKVVGGGHREGYGGGEIGRRMRTIEIQTRGVTETEKKEGDPERRDKGTRATDTKK